MKWMGICFFSAFLFVRFAHCCAIQSIPPGRYLNSDIGSFSEIFVMADGGEPKLRIVLNSVRSQINRPVEGITTSMDRSEVARGVLRFEGVLRAEEACELKFDISISRVSSLASGGCEFFVEANLPISELALGENCGQNSQRTKFIDLNSYRGPMRAKK